VNLPAIPTEAIMASSQATMDIPITITESRINRKINNRNNVIEVVLAMGPNSLFGSRSGLWQHVAPQQKPGPLQLG
jgi:hypothetical protein